MSGGRNLLQMQTNWTLTFKTWRFNPLMRERRVTLVDTAAANSSRCGTFNESIFKKNNRNETRRHCGAHNCSTLDNRKLKVNESFSLGEIYCF